LLLFGASGAFVACAQAGGHGIGGGGMPDLAGGGNMGQPDLSGTTGGPMPDFAGLDLFGVDLTFVGSNNDLAVNCNVYTQMGCGANEKCSFGPTCISDGTVPTGGLCGTNMGADDCIHGNICLQNSPSTISDCREFCMTDADCKQTPVPAGTTNKPRCLLQVTAGSAMDAGVLGSVCTVACNPAPGAGALGCATGLNCSVWTDGTNQFTDCGTAGAAGDGGDCTTNGNYDCAAGYDCVAFTSGGTTVHHCRKACRANMAGTDCTAGDTCITPSGGNALYGFCCPTAGC
jgi:hypothetical protein